MQKAALIGMGDIYHIHLAALRTLPNVQIVGVCDTDPAAAVHAPEGAAFYTDYLRMVQECKPDCVHICLPHFLHYPVSRALVEQGIPVFCEKPVAMNAPEAMEFAALEQAHPNVKMGICLQNRCNETVELLKALIDSGKYGAVTGCKGLVPWARSKEYYDSKPWRGKWDTAGGGCMINQSVHTLDLLQYLCGPVESLRGSASQLLDYGIEVEDTVTARLHFASGATGVFWATNANSKNEGVQISVSLEKAEFEIVDNILYERGADGTKTKLCEDARMPGAKFYYGASHAKLIAKFYAALAQSSDDYIHVRDAVMSIRLIDAVQASSRTGKAMLV